MIPYDTINNHKTHAYSMSYQETERIRFNQWIDELVGNVISRNLGTAEFRAEYVKAANLYKRVAEFDPKLASDLWLSTMMVSYTFALGIARDLVKLGK
jgi:hypothetical protein